MEYFENALRYADYCKLRKSVGWPLFSEEQTRRALANSLYAVTAADGGEAVGMGRLAGDGMYYLLADVVVCPAFQKKGIGSRVVERLTAYVERHTPPGGRSSIQLIAEPGKEGFYERLGFRSIPHEHCGAGMRKVVRK